MAELRSAGIEAKADKLVVADPSVCRSTGFTLCADHESLRARTGTPSNWPAQSSRTGRHRRCRAWGPTLGAPQSTGHELRQRTRPRLVVVVEVAEPRPELLSEEPDRAASPLYATSAQRAQGDGLNP
jgi:hypothetical protein